MAGASILKTPLTRIKKGKGKEKKTLSKLKRVGRERKKETTLTRMTTVERERKEKKKKQDEKGRKGKKDPPPLTREERVGRERGGKNGAPLPTLSPLPSDSPLLSLLIHVFRGSPGLGPPAVHVMCMDQGMD